MKKQNLISKLHKPVYHVLSSAVLIVALLCAIGVFVVLYASHTSSSQQPKITYSMLSVTPASTLIIASPNGTQNWKVYISTDYHFGLRYPQDLKITYITPIVNEKSNGVIFYREGTYKENPDFKFSVIAGSGDILNKTYVLGSDDRLLSDLFNNPYGILRDNLANGSNFPKERIIVTKIASLNINGYPAVNFTDVYTGGTQQPPDYANRYIIKTPKGYYLISQGFVSSQTKLDQYASELRLIVNTFTIL